MVKGTKAIVLPALRGVMGDWVYYTCLMNLSELSSRVHYAKEVHKNKALSDMIQRHLKIKRAAQIAKYLKHQPERFFNSLVIAIYGGQPNWHAISDVRSNGLDDDPYDEVSVILVGHKNTRQGLERTRRLFTTLNKTARPVSKGEVIALDEDDVMAICVRHLLEQTDLFARNRIAFVASNNMPTANTTSLTTIGNLYDVLTILFTRAQSDLKKQKTDLQRVRPDAQTLEKYFIYSRNYFIQLRKHYRALNEFFGASNTEPVVRKYRGNHGGHVLFRPIGLEIITRVVARFTRDMSISQAIKLAAKLPTSLNEEPYERLMWDPSRKTMLNGHKVTIREVLLYMVRKNAKNYSQATLLKRYQRETGSDAADLPGTII